MPTIHPSLFLSGWSAVSIRSHRGAGMYGPAMNRSAHEGDAVSKPFFLPDISELHLKDIPCVPKHHLLTFSKSGRFMKWSGCHSVKKTISITPGSSLFCCMVLARCPRLLVIFSFLMLFSRSHPVSTRIFAPTPNTLLSNRSPILQNYSYQPFADRLPQTY